MEKICLYPPPPSSSSHTNKNIYLVGPFLGNTSVLKQIEKCGLRIVGDNLTNSKRLAWDEYCCEKEHFYIDIAAHILRHQIAPTMERFSAVWENDFVEIKRKNVKGVVFLCQKFCEPYDYLYSLYEARLQETGIPIIRIYVNDIDNAEAAIAIWETFYETI